MDPIYLVQPQNRIVVDENAQLSIVEIIRPITDSAIPTHRQTEIIVGKGAKVNHYFIQYSPDNRIQTADIQISQQGFSDYHCIALLAGGITNEAHFQINLNHTKASAKFTALQLGYQHYQTELHLNILHHVPACRSLTQAKAVAKNSGKAHFTGKIYVAKHAALTEATLQSKNLLLDSKAEIKALPELEIYHDNIQCNHGATVGSLDEEALFYLRSRGIEEKEAEKLIISGFLNPILTEIPDLFQHHFADIIHEF